MRSATTSALSRSSDQCGAFAFTIQGWAVGHWKSIGLSPIQITGPVCGTIGEDPGSGYSRWMSRCGVLRAFLVSVVLIVWSCGGTGGKTEGTEGGPCYGNGSCNGSLICLSHLCVQPAPADAATGGAAGGASGSGGSGGATSSGGTAGQGAGGSGTIGPDGGLLSKPGYISCSGACVTSDATHCGACGVTCTGRTPPCMN